MSATYETAFSLPTYVELEKESTGGIEAPTLRNKSLTLSTAVLAPSVFQPRLLGDEYSKYVSKKHIETLMNSAPNEPNWNLDPITVWWSGARWIVIDGQHRYETYKRLHKLKKRSASFPVRVFSGTLTEARRQASYLNRKTQLPMTGEDRVNQAWQFVIEGKSSIKQIREATGVSKGTVNNQRRVLKNLQEQHPEDWGQQLEGLPWRRVLHLWDAKEYTEDDNEKTREQLTKMFLKGLTPNIVQHHPDLVFDTMIKVYPSLERRGAEYFAEYDAYKDHYALHKQEIEDDSDF